MKLEIEINGKTRDDLVTALEEVSRLVNGGYITGYDCNENGNYSFKINSGDEK